ncbi:slipin family protein [Kozakia baliensis]|uniref:slipin family protein n=1 Tax=Kozakia baliensis TaxID=153496 RepID=UPI00345BD3B8
MPTYPQLSASRFPLPVNSISAPLAGFCVLAGLVASVGDAHDRPYFLLGGIVLGICVLLSVRLCSAWERAVVLRAGKIKGVYGPGIFLTVPFLDQVTEVVDQRIRTVPVNTRQTLTRDTTPVDVDAVIFWMVHDPLRAVTELDAFAASVSMVALTTLREVVSSSDLSVLLEDRRRIDDELREQIARKTSEWGVTVQGVEIRDVQLPVSLQDAMSRQAQAEREKAARVTLASAERAVALELSEAAKSYEASPVALQILQINRIFEMNKDRGTTILMPTTMADSMAGIAGLNIANLAAANSETETASGS